MKQDKSDPGLNPEHSPAPQPVDDGTHPDSVCPVCGEKVVQEKCKVVCRSARCVYRIIYTCAEF